MIVVATRMEIITTEQDQYVTSSIVKDKGCDNNPTLDMNIESDTAASVQQQPFRQVRNIPIYFHEDWRTGIGGGLWSTGLAMGQYFISTESAMTNLYQLSQRCSATTTTSSSSSSSSVSDSNQGQQTHLALSILELGSGNGFLAVCLAAAITSMSSSTTNRNEVLRIRNLVITDEIDHLRMIQTTIQNNPKALECVDNLTIQEHRWGVFTDNTNSTIESSTGSLKNTGNSTYSNNHIVLDGATKFDFIIGSDVAYHDSLVQPLLTSILHFSHHDTISLIGITMMDTKPSFFHELDRHGFIYQKLADHLLDPQFRGTTFGIFAIQKK